MCRFYGWTLDYVLSLELDHFNYLWESITVIEAREMLNNIAVGDFAHIKQSSRDKIYKQLSSEANPASLKPAIVGSNKDLARLLGG